MMKTLAAWSAGWSKGRRPEEARWFLQKVTNLQRRGLPLVVASLDVRKAFDRYWWSAIKRMARALRINEKLIMELLIEEAGQQMGIECEAGMMTEPIPR